MNTIARSAWLVAALASSAVARDANSFVKSIVATPFFSVTDRRPQSFGSGISSPLSFSGPFASSSIAVVRSAGENTVRVTGTISRPSADGKYSCTRDAFVRFAVVSTLSRFTLSALNTPDTSVPCVNCERF